jgi:ATP-dependent DNA helicase RecG
MIDIAEKYIRNNIRWRVVLDGSIKRKEIPEIPMDAVREALVNSFCHRDYKSSQNNEVTIYSNRVEIYNPGTFPEGLTPQDFIENTERSVKRNPLLAQLMYYVKDIESFGTGLKRITDACEEANVKVEFQMLKKGFAVVFYRDDDIYADTDADEKFGERFGEKFGEKFGENQTQEKIMAIMRLKPTISAKSIAEDIGITTRGVEKSIFELKKAGYIERVGAARNGHWVVKK